MRHRPSIVVVLLCVAAAPLEVSHAAPDQELEVFVGGDLRLFNYREFSEDGRELNHEYGALPGFRVAVQGGQGRLFARGEASIHAGEVVYDGETQAGDPVTSTTETGLANIALDLGAWIGPQRRHWGGYLHLGRRVWNRDIQSTSGAQGIFERYRWSEAGVGVRHIWPQSFWGRRWRHEIAATLFAVVDGEIFVELSELETGGATWDDKTLDLGDAGGLRVRYAATRALGSGFTLRIAPYIAAWEFGRSNSETVTADGQPADCRPNESGFQGCSVVEPRSESQRIGVSVGLVF